MRTRALPLFFLLLGACVSRGPTVDPLPEPAVQTPPPAQAQTPAATAFEPVGTYEFNAEMMGQTQSGVLQITRTNGQLGGSITVREEALPLRDIKVEARKITAVGVPPGNENIQINLVFTFEDNDRYTGTLTVPQMGEMGAAKVWGTRKKT